MLENIGNFILTCLCGSRKIVKGEEIEIDRRYPRKETNTYKKCENYSPKTSKSVCKM